MSKEVVVIGQRRSGTSAVAGVVEKLGINMGNTGGASERNPKGFFEDQDITEVSKKIIAYVNKHLNEGKSRPTIAKIERKFDDEVREVIEHRKEQNKVWGFKDANQIRTHKFFMKHLENPYYIFVFRNLLDVAISVMDWHGDEHPESGIGDYLSTVNKLNGLQFKLINLVNNRGNMIFISFDRMLREPESYAEKITDFLPTNPDNDKIKDAVNHIEPQTLKTIQDGD